MNVKVRIGRTVSVTKKGLRVVSLDPSVDYVKVNLIGRTVRSSDGKDVGRVLDVIGNVKNPYAVIQAAEELEEGRFYVDLRRRK
jgi:rRNA processing protein Gar1